MRYKETMTLSFSAETKSRLRAYAEQKHTTVSQAITDWIWSQSVTETSQTEVKENTGVEEK